MKSQLREGENALVFILFYFTSKWVVLSAKRMCSRLKALGQLFAALDWLPHEKVLSRKMTPMLSTL